MARHVLSTASTDLSLDDLHTHAYKRIRRIIQSPVCPAQILVRIERDMRT